MNYPQVTYENTFEEVNENHERLLLDLEILTEPKFSDKVVRDLNKKKHVSIDGFRRGKVPKSVMEKYLGKERLYADAIMEQYDIIQEKQGYETATSPSLVELHTNPDGSIKFKVNVEVIPEFSIDESHYIGIEVEKDEPSEEKAQSYLERDLASIQNQFGTYEPVERPAQVDDHLVITLETVVDGKALPELTFEDNRIQLDERHLVKEVLDIIVGMKEEEEQETDVSFPDDHSNNHLAGKTAHVKVSLESVKELIPHPLDDDLAKQTNQAKTLDELKETYLNRYRDQEQQMIDRTFELEAVDAVVSKIDLKVPEVMINQEISNMLNYRKGAFVEAGLPEDMAYQNLDFALMQRQAKGRVAIGLIFERLLKDGVLNPDDATQEQIDEYIQKKCEDHNITKDQAEAIYEPAESLEALKKEIVYDGFMKKIVENAKPVPRTIKNEEEDAVPTSDE